MPDHATKNPQFTLTPREELLAARQTRRRFLTGTGASAALAFAGTLAGVDSPARAEKHSTATEDLFTLGVASGDPLPDAVVIWTRLAPRPFESYSGLGRKNVTVEWQVSEDENFTKITRSGKAVARPEYAHSVHVDVKGLEPWHRYFYRFRCLGQISPSGRMRTAPRADQKIDSMKLAIASCQKWDNGLYTAHQDMAAKDHDVVMFVGDYIYENAILPVGGGGNRYVPEERDVRELKLTGTPDRDGGRPDVLVRPPQSLDEYRMRYALYKLDPDLQASHAACPWVVTLDDHEVEDDWADDISKTLDPPEMLVRRANAFRAYWEHMPLRIAQRPQGPDMRLYRSVPYGRLAEFLVMDTRQYRDKIPEGGGWTEPGKEAKDPDRTITGAAQEKWILDRCAASDATWNVLVQQVVMTHMDRLVGPGTEAPMSSWDGYYASRDRILGGIVERGTDNLVVTTGDIHRNFMADLKLDYDDPKAHVIGSEFVTTSITSKGDGGDTDDLGKDILKENPHIKFHNDQRGYISCVVTPESWTSDYRVVDKVSSKGGKVTTRATYMVSEGHPGAQEV